MASDRVFRWLGGFAAIFFFLAALGFWALVRQYRACKRTRHLALYPPGQTPQDLHALHGGVGLEDFDLDRLPAPSRARLRAHRVYELFRFSGSKKDSLPACPHPGSTVVTG